MNLSIPAAIVKSFRVKFILGVLVLIFIALVFFSIFSAYHSINLLNKGLIKKGETLVKDLSYTSELGILAGDPTFVEASSMGIFEEKEVLFLVIYNIEGKIIAVKKDIEINQEIPDSIKQELIDRKIVIRKESFVGEERIYEFFAPVAARISAGVPGRIIGFSRLGISLKDISKEERDMFFFHLIVALATIFIAGIALVYTVKKILKPVDHLMIGIEAIKREDFSYKIKKETEDEFGRLADAFNRMTKDVEISHAVLKEAKEVLAIKVEARTKELRELTESLEEKVKQRTKELQERIDELERYHRLTVGRELKMVELKKEIEILKKELGNKPR